MITIIKVRHTIRIGKPASTMSVKNKTNRNRAKTRFNKILDLKAKNKAADETSGLKANGWDPQLDCWRRK
jgi:hypothetical protein